MIRKYKVRVDGKEYAVEVEGVEEEKRFINEGERAENKKVSVKEKEPYGKLETVASQEKAVFSPMPAKVIKVNCKPRETVKKGDLLLVIEAMKMENEIISPRDGEIKEVRAVEGASVSQGEILLVFE